MHVVIEWFEPNLFVFLLEWDNDDNRQSTTWTRTWTHHTTSRKTSFYLSLTCTRALSFLLSCLHFIACNDQFRRRRMLFFFFPLLLSHFSCSSSFPALSSTIQWSFIQCLLLCVARPALTFNAFRPGGHH